MSHIFIDDDSSDKTQHIVSDWMERSPKHRVTFICRTKRQGGCANNLDGFRQASDDSIVVELNGDDWLEGRSVLSFLDRVYSNRAVWMTYNGVRLADGAQKPEYWFPVPRTLLEANRYRCSPRWYSSHLHTFRKALLAYVRDDAMRDPETGEYWESADDRALYTSLFELCGPDHALHIYRPLYVYNMREYSELNKDRAGTELRVERIKAVVPHQRLDTLPIAQPEGGKN